LGTDQPISSEGIVLLGLHHGSNLKRLDLAVPASDGWRFYWRRAVRSVPQIG
jgi:hypothetical protein